MHFEREGKKKRRKVATVHLGSSLSPHEHDVTPTAAVHVDPAWLQWAADPLKPVRLVQRLSRRNCFNDAEWVKRLNQFQKVKSVQLFDAMRWSTA
jgi:hypothetical protein